MNCYYSNLIEGHDTLPRDIDRALKSEYVADPKRRNLQVEARAHIEVQAMVDHGGLDSIGTGQNLVRVLHRELCGRLPDELLCGSKTRPRARASRLSRENGEPVA